MKKNWKIVVTVALMMAWLCLFTAEAEVKIVLGRTTSTNVGNWSNGDIIWENHYFAKVVSDKGVETEIEITEEEHDALVEEFFKTHKPVPADPRPWYEKAVSAMTFWNPND